MKKLCSLVLAGAVLLGALCVPCSAAGQAAAAETAAASGADSRVSAGLAGGYRRYRQSHADAVRPSATADVPIGTAKKADGQSAVFVTDGDTVRPAVQIADGESIVLTVDVPETGLYQVQVLYRPLPGKDIDLSCALYIDGALPFSSAAGLTLTRTWKDSDERSFSDDQGNEYRPVQVEQSQWMSAWLCAKDEYLDGGYEFYLTAGTHALTLESVQEGFLLGGMTLGREETAPTYAEYLAAHKAEGRTPESISAEPVFLEGEDAARRSHPILYSIADYSSCITQPYDVYRSLQNTIGGENWSAKGQWLQWDFTVGTAGFYQLAFRFKQNYKSGSFSVRRLTVDGAVPFAEAGQIDGQLLPDDGRARRQDQYAVAHADALGDVVRHHQRRHLFPADDAVHILGHLQPRLIIQRRERLVQQQDVRLGRQSADQRRTLPHPAGQLRRPCILKVTESIDVKKLMCPLLRTRCQCVLDFQPKDYVIINRAPFKEFIVL